MIFEAHASAIFFLHVRKYFILFIVILNHFIYNINILMDSITSSSSSSSNATNVSNTSSSTVTTTTSSSSSSTSTFTFPLSTALFPMEKHKVYITNLDKQRDSYEHIVTEHLRMSGIYWGLGAMEILNAGADLNKPKIVEFIQACYHPNNGGYSGNIGHDPHLLYTLSALQLLAMCDRLDLVDIPKTSNYIINLQLSDGSFMGDEFGEVDTRFTYCAFQALALLKSLDKINIPKAVEFIQECRNFDGGFGAIPGSESHAGQIFCCVGALAIVNRLDIIDAHTLGWWLAERQVDSGGLNGRPEKQSDVCYSWWILSCLSILGRLDWINQTKLIQFILDCQDKENGGISDRPNNAVDVFHTFFGITGLSLLGALGSDDHDSHQIIDPIYALPLKLTKKLQLPRTILEKVTKTERI